MPTTYRTRPGDMLDLICWRHYGRRTGTVEVVLEANRGLAALPIALPAGTRIVLPDLPAAPTGTATVKLWD